MQTLREKETDNISEENGTEINEQNGREKKEGFLLLLKNGGMSYKEEETNLFLK